MTILGDELQVRCYPDVEDGGMHYLVWRDGELTHLSLTEETFARWDVAKIERMYGLCLKLANGRMVGFCEYEPGRFYNCVDVSDHKDPAEHAGLER